jgi:hypothetical protein
MKIFQLTLIPKLASVVKPFIELNLVFFLIGYTVSAQTSLCLSGETANLPDQLLYSVIQRAIWEEGQPWPPSSLLCEDLQELVALGAHFRCWDNECIRTLEGLQYATNLKSLDLAQNQLIDVSLLAQLSKLERVQLRENAIDDINFALRLIPLNYLDIALNCLDMTPNSSDMQVIEVLLARGVTVTYEPQWNQIEKGLNCEKIWWLNPLK